MGIDRALDMFFVTDVFQEAVAARDAGKLCEWTMILVLFYFSLIKICFVPFSVLFLFNYSNNR